MEDLDFAHHDIRRQTIIFNISPAGTVPKMVWIHWTVEQIKLEASLAHPYEGTAPTHHARISSTKSSEANDEYACQILNWDANTELPLLSNFTSMRALVWNCNIASIETITSAPTEMPGHYNPDIVLLLETRLPMYESGGMGLFSSLGLDATTHIDPERGEGGIRGRLERTKTKLHSEAANDTDGAYPQRLQQLDPHHYLRPSKSRELNNTSLCCVQFRKLRLC